MPDSGTRGLIAYNMNWHVRVRLTTYGRRVLREYWTPFVSGRKTGPWDDVTDDGWYETQMHDLMRVFGQHLTMNMSAELPFETEIFLVCER